MKIAFRVDESDKSKLQGILDEDPISRISINQRNSSSLGLDQEGIVLMLEGEKEVCEQAKEKIQEFGDELEGDEKDEVIRALEEAEKEAAEGFGSIFG